MCCGSRMGTAIRVHGSTALMMMALDLLCSALCALELQSLVRQEDDSPICSSMYRHQHLLDHDKGLKIKSVFDALHCGN